MNDIVIPYYTCIAKYKGVIRYFHCLSGSQYA